MANAITSFIRGILYPKGSTPLKWKEIMILFVALLSTAMTITMLFPFLPAMIKYFGKTEEETGYFAGLVASSMFLGRFLSSYSWGILADKVGRKPVIITSLILLGMSTLLFGLSSSVAMAMATRFLVGLGSGIIGTAKAMISEVCDASNQSLGMSTITISFTTGLIIGPALGGFLSETGIKYPKTFPKDSFFDRNPFFLPCVVNSVLLMFSAVIAYKWLPETLVKSKKSNKESKCSCFRIFRLSKKTEASKTSSISSQSENNHIPSNPETLELKKVQNSTTIKRESLSDNNDEHSGLILNESTTEYNTCKPELEKNQAAFNDDSLLNKVPSLSKIPTHSSYEECSSSVNDHKTNLHHEEQDEQKLKLSECQPITSICDGSDDIESKGDLKKTEESTLHGKDDMEIKSDFKSIEETKILHTENKVNINSKECVEHVNTTDFSGEDIVTLHEADAKSHTEKNQKNSARELVEVNRLDERKDENSTSGELNIDKKNLPKVSFECKNADNSSHCCTRTTDSKIDTDKESNKCCGFKFKKNSNLWRILSNRNAALVLAIYVTFGFAQMGIDELIYVWAAADPRLGGLGFSTDDMGTFLLVIGIVITFFQPTVLPKIERKLGCLMNLQMSLIISLFFSVTLPSIRIAINRPDILWTLLLVCLTMKRMAMCGAYLSIFLLLNNSVQRDLLCSINGLGLMLSSLSKTFGPTLGGSLLSWSLSSGKTLGFPFNVNMAFIFFGFVLIMTVAISCFVSESLNEPLDEKEVLLRSSKSVENLLESKA